MIQGLLSTAPPQSRPGGWKYTHQVGSTTDVHQIHHYKVGNRSKTSSPHLLDPTADGAKAHIVITQVLSLSYLIQWLP